MNPYSVTPHHYPFPALAAQAGRGQVGGTREIALACLMAARLAAEARVAATELGLGARADRAASARGWFAALSVPAALRTACARLLDATSRGDASEASSALAAVVAAGRRQLDGASVAELERVVATLRET